MDLKILIVSKYNWPTRNQKHEEIRKILKLCPDIGRVEFVFERRSDIGIPELYVANDGKMRIKEEWFEKNISLDAKAKGFTHAGFIFSDKDGNAWGIGKGHRGLNFRDGDFFGEFWIKADENSKRKYKGGDTRLTYVVDVPHEMGHEFTRTGLTKMEMHDYDFQGRINAIEEFYSKLRITKPSLINVFLNRALNLLGIMKTMVTTPKDKNQLLYEAAVKYIGTDASPSDLAKDEVGCMETVSNIVNDVIDFPITLGTWTGWDWMMKHKTMFRLVEKPRKGSIIICATVKGRPFPGHVGIVGENDQIMSNDSKTGKFLQNYTIATWNAYYAKKGGYKVYYFDLV